MTTLIDIVMPQGQQEGTKSIIANWLKKPGDTVKEHEPVVEISTDKVMMEVAAPAGGIIKEIIKDRDSEVTPGMVLGRMELRAANLEGPATAGAHSSEQQRRAVTSPASTSGAESDLSPAVKKLLKDNNLSAAQISGTGKGGRITHDDVMKFLQNKPSSGLSGRKVPHTPMRRSIADHMVMSMLRTAPHVTAVFQCDLTAISAHRAKHKAEFEKQGAKLTFTTYFIAATVKALQAVPQVNSRFHQDSLEIFEDFNIGIATALETEGLIVPVMQQAQKLDLLGIAKKLGDLTTRARSNKLEGSEVQNGTFTITNHGVSGSLIATPIINQPQSAILGIGKLEKRAIVVERDGKDTIEIKPMVYVTLTIDHRALDGFVANAFLTAFVATIEGWRA